MGYNSILAFQNKLRYCYLLFIWLREIRVLTGEGGRGDGGTCRPHSLCSELLFFLLFLFGWGLLAHIAEVRVRVGFGGQRLFAASTGRQQLSFLGISPFHPSVLKPNFYLQEGENHEWVKLFVDNGLVARGLRNWFLRTAYWTFWALASFTCESFRPSLDASFFLSGLLMYFCFWNIFSKALRCTSENTALLSIPLRGFPLAAKGHEKVPGIGTTDEDATVQEKQNRKLSGSN